MRDLSGKGGGKTLRMCSMIDFDNKRQLDYELADRNY